MLFLDESAVYLLPAVAKTWAPRGHPPVLRHGNLYTHLNLISAISPEGALYFQCRRTAFDSAGVIDFLTALHATVPGKLLVIWDGASIHRSDEIKQFLREGADHWLTLERLPAYAPELNPDEEIWNRLKNIELKNICCQKLADLEHLAQTTLQKIKESVDIVKGCFAKAGYS